MITGLVKSAARRLGVEIRRFQPSSSAAAQLRALLNWHAVDLVLDVGANAGQFGTELRRHVGYRGRIVSFEPLKAAHAALTTRAARDRMWDVAPRMAIGSADGTIEINVANNSLSSSVLQMLDAHESAAPTSRYVGSETVPLARLDSVSPHYLAADSVVFLKVDVQGYEEQVLRGAAATLPRVTGVQLELSLVPLYEGQTLMPELMAFMEAVGFTLFGISPTFADPNTGRMLQMDGIFFRSV